MVLDKILTNTGSHHVYVDDNSGVVFDACLNQTNLGANNNKFYNIQLLESDNGKTYSTFTHWGRVGEKGQNKMLCQGASFPTAEAAFDKQFKTKTGKYWADRANAHGGSSKYAYLERNYEDDEEDAGTGSSDPSTAPKIPESTIAKPLQELVKLIFNTKIMEQSMASMSYDANKLPLGKLSKETITRGYLVLKEIGAVISDPAYPNKKNRLDELAGQYYTVIPHDFGRQRPTPISTAQALKQETELIEALTDLKITAEIMASTKQAHDINPLDNQFNSLNLNEAEPLDHTSSEFKLLEAYLHKTHGSTHLMTLRVEEIFRITRSSEIDRWDAAGFGSIPNSNRKLLWHGSRTTNYSGILSQGLRIAPPEAPVSGYMFDKGIYLADIATKSANYCYAGASDNTGLLMLCEAQLGDPMLELTRAAYDAATSCKNAGALATKGLGRVAPLKWEDAGAVNKQLKGVTMPKVSGSEKTIVGDAKVTGAGLQYNEVWTSFLNHEMVGTNGGRTVYRVQCQSGEDSVLVQMQVWKLEGILHGDCVALWVLLWACLFWEGFTHFGVELALSDLLCWSYVVLYDKFERVLFFRCELYDTTNTNAGRNGDHIPTHLRTALTHHLRPCPFNPMKAKGGYWRTKFW